MQLEDISYPRHVENIKEIGLMSSATDKAIAKIAEYLDSMDADLTILTADETGIARREKILKITPLDTDTLDERRYRVWTMWYDTYPYTERDLRERLSRLCPDNGYQLTIDYDSLTVTCKLGLPNKKNYAAMVALLEQLVPLHLIISTTLLYNTWEMFASKAWSSLSAVTWQSMREDVL